MVAPLNHQRRVVVELTKFGSAPPAKKTELALRPSYVHLLIEYLDGIFVKTI